VKKNVFVKTGTMIMVSTKSVKNVSTLVKFVSILINVLNEIQ
jgi:hypothetical protein